MIQMKYE